MNSIIINDIEQIITQLSINRQKKEIHTFSIQFFLRFNDDEITATARRRWMRWFLFLRMYTHTPEHDKIGIIHIV